MQREVLADIDHAGSAATHRYLPVRQRFRLLA